MKNDAMTDVLSRFPSQIREAIALGDRYAPRGSQPVDRVVVAGMGGSAMGATLVAQWLSATNGKVPIVVHRDYGLPSFVNSKTLVVACSYSGETEETLTAFDEAKARGAALLAITTGGALSARAASAGADVIQVPTGYQPRAALGFMAIPLAIALESWGLAKGARKSAETVLRAVDPLAKELSAEGDNEARRLSKKLSGRTTVAYGLGPYEPAARRFANEVSEMGKALAFSGAIPEICHNDLVGWAGDDASKFAVVIVTGPGAGRANEERAKFVGRIASERGAIVAEIRARGAGDLLADLFCAIYVGDWASVYLAHERGLDPTPVEVIGRLKNELAQLGTLSSFRSSPSE